MLTVAGLDYRVKRWTPSANESFPEAKVKLRGYQEEMLQAALKHPYGILHAALAPEP